MRHVVILGCGMAGFHAARQLEKELAGRRRVQLTVISDQAHFVFTPLLATVAGGELGPDHIVAPIDELLGHRTRVVVDPIVDIDLSDQHLIGQRDRYPFDYLLIATGGDRDPTAFEGAGDLQAPTRLGDATQIREFLNDLRRATSFRATIAGGGLTGVQWAAQLASLQAQGELPGGTLSLVEAGSRILPHHSAQLAAQADAQLRQMGVTIHTDAPVESVQPHSDRWDVHLGSRGPLEGQDAVFHCAGRRGHLPDALAHQLATDDTRRLNVNKFLMLPSHQALFAAGDITSRRREWALHSTPQLAVQQGEWAARNLLAAMSGRSLRPFQMDTRGDFLHLGPHHTLLEMGDVILEGRPAWLAHRIYYTSMMPQPIQKARLVMDWVARRLTEKSPSS